jgi:hypothetical protein
VINPSGDLARYRALSLDLPGSGIRHVVGCYTSSRKEVIPCFEKHDGLLWYPSHYEGFESSDNVIYTGAAPNQHVLPLLNAGTLRPTLAVMPKGTVMNCEEPAAVGMRSLTCSVAQNTPVGVQEVARRIVKLVCLRKEFSHPAGYSRRA